MASTAKDLSGTPIGNPNPPATDSTGSNKVDFETLMSNSNLDALDRREAIKNGDFSGAKDEKEFFEMLTKSTKNTDAPKNHLEKDDFLKLFIAQLQNQDPLKPKEDTEVAAQLAQFNALEQMLNVNKKLEEMNQNNVNGQAVHLINYVGKDISVENGKILVRDGKPVDGVINVSSNLNGAILEVRDASGTVVSEAKLTDLKSGENALDLELVDKEKGTKLANGAYTIAVSTVDSNNQRLKIPVTTNTRVTGVDLSQNGGALYTDLGRLQLKDIKSIGLENYKKQAKMLESSGMSLAGLQNKQEKAGTSKESSAGISQNMANPAKIEPEAAISKIDNVKQSGQISHVQSPENIPESNQIPLNSGNVQPPSAGANQ